MLTGIIFYVVVGIITYFIYGAEYRIILDPTYLTFSIFIAFAFNFPEERLLLMFLFPIKAKYVAVLEILIYLLIFSGAGIGVRASILASMLSAGLFMYFVDKYSFKYFFNSLFKL